MLPSLIGCQMQLTFISQCVIRIVNVKEDQPKKKEFPFFIFVSIYLSRVGYLRAIVLHTVNLSPSAAYSGGGSSSSTYLPSLPQRDLLDASWQPSYSFTVWSCRAWPFFFPSPFFFPFVKKKKNERWRRWNQTELLLSHCVCVRTSPGTLPKKQHKIPPKKHITRRRARYSHRHTA